MDADSLIIVASASLLVGSFLLVFLVNFYFSFVVVEKGTAVIVERWGKFHKKLNPGFYFLIPFKDSIRRIKWRNTQTFVDSRGQQSVTVTQSTLSRIDLRENVMDFPHQAIITRDNVEILVHPMLLYVLIDPVRVAYETYDLAHAAEKIVQTTLRSIIGDMGLDDTLASREEINRGLTQKISDVCLNWGMRITRVDILEIIPTYTIQTAMHQQLAAERVRRANIVSSEGYREQTKTEAEGECQSMITISKGEQQATMLRAKSRGEAKLLLAKAEAEATKILGKELAEFGVDPTQYLIGLRYIESLQACALGASHRTLLFPLETQLVGAARDVGLGVH